MVSPEPTEVHEESYRSLLSRYCVAGDPDLLPEAVLFAEECIANNVLPMDVREIHDRAVTGLLDSEDTDAFVAAHRLLLEVLFAYGVAFAERADRLLAEAAALARTEGAQTAEGEKLAILASISHELANPLTVVKVNVASIRKELEERGSWAGDLDQREADISYAVERMMALREELLAASRNESREMDIMPLPLTHCLRRVIRWATHAAAEKRIELTEEAEDSLPYVLADEIALQSILTNLLSNAIRYTATGGSITVRSKCEDSRVAVEVQDTGIGISEEDLTRIYERFFRAENAKEAVVFGVGVGLSLTRDAVTSMGGTIDVTSELGVGSTFRVTFPIAEEPETDDA